MLMLIVVAGNGAKELLGVLTGSFSSSLDFG
jgi:hypothetical protein